MKEVKVEKKIVETKYETVDGEIFDRKDTAMIWEERLSSIAYERLGDRIKTIVPKREYFEVSEMSGMDCDCYMKLFAPRDETDIKNFFMFAEASDRFFLSPFDMKKEMKPNEKYIIFISKDNDYMTAFSKDSFEKFIEERRKYLNDMFDSIEKQEQ